jgi:hypothetical protein
MNTCSRAGRAEERQGSRRGRPTPSAWWSAPSAQFYSGGKLDPPQIAAARWEAGSLRRASLQSQPRGGAVVPSRPQGGLRGGGAVAPSRPRGGDGGLKEQSRRAAVDRRDLGEEQ